MKVYPGNGFAIIEEKGNYRIEWPQGPFDQPVIYPINKELAEKAFRSSEDAYEVMIYAETGHWPNVNSKAAGKRQARETIKKFPELLHKVPANQALFSKKELEELLPLAKKIGKD